MTTFKEEYYLSLFSVVSAILSVPTVNYLQGQLDRLCLQNSRKCVQKMYGKFCTVK